MHINGGNNRLWFGVMLPFGLGYLITIAVRSINAILAHPLMQDLGLSGVEIGLITSTFLLGTMVATLPIGVLLDHWGARKTQATFFLISGAGLLLFAAGSSLTELSIARFIIGVGMSGALLAAVKAIAEWVEADRIPFFNGLIMAFGGLGALVGATPSKLIEIDFGWRVLCIAFAVAIIAAALLILILSRDRPNARRRSTRLWDQIAGLGSIYRSAFFWRIAPLFTVTLGGFIALHIATEILIVTNLFPTNLMVWLAFGFLAQITLVNHAVLAQHFGPELAGRATSAANVLVFLFAFAAQYFFGLIAHGWQGGIAHPVTGYRVAFACLIVLEILALLWFVASARLGYRSKAGVGER